jgi:hypothetical protein
VVTIAESVLLIFFSDQISKSELRIRFNQYSKCKKFLGS